VATDRLSAFDCILPTGIPGKGRILTAISCYWFRALEGSWPTHFVSDRVEDFRRRSTVTRSSWPGGSMYVRKARRIDIECVVRGYLAGSGWKDYQTSGAVCGIALPPGLLEAQRLPEPLFTPATKNDTGHDENVPYDEARRQTGPELDEARRLSLALYHNLAATPSRGASSWPTPSSIRSDRRPGGADRRGRLARFLPLLGRRAVRAGPESGVVRQAVRPRLADPVGLEQGTPAPALPREIVERTVGRYDEAVRRLIDGAHPLRFSQWGWQWI